MKYQILLAVAAFFCLVCLEAPAVAAAVCHPDDEAGLLAFKSGITADPLGLLSSWKRGTDCCKWNGVECRENNRVTSLSLSGQADNPRSFLSGTVSPSLARAKFIDGIHFNDLKRLSGPFPEAFFNLPSLSIVYMVNVGLTGPIPERIGALRKLIALGLNQNRLVGQIPASIANLTEMIQLNLGSNKLTGSIPPGLKNLKKMSSLSLDNNQLSGPIPGFLGSLTGLVSINLSHNRLTGNIPISIAALAPNLRYLELGHNALAGTIPDFLGRFTALDTLDLSSNRFAGTVPKSFANLTKIFNLDLSRNALVDPFPALRVKGIESLDLSHNYFHLEKIPEWVTSSPIIYSLKLAKCGIKMRLEDWRPAETYFYDYIDLSGNQITGSPVRLLNSTEYLVGFRARGNKLKFDLESLKFPKTLKDLNLARNLVYGKVPNAVSGLRRLNVSSNHLCGPLPATKFPATAFLGNDCLCGPPLAPCKKA